MAPRVCHAEGRKIANIDGSSQVIRTIPKNSGSKRRYARGSALPPNWREGLTWGWRRSRSEAKFNFAVSLAKAESAAITMYEILRAKFLKQDISLALFVGTG